jgi:hypothetical protein
MRYAIFVFTLMARLSLGSVSELHGEVPNGVQKMRVSEDQVRPEERAAAKAFASDHGIPDLASVAWSGSGLFALGPEKREGRNVITKYLTLYRLGGSSPVVVDVKVVNGFYLGSVRTNTNTVLRIMKREVRVRPLILIPVATAEAVVEKILRNEFQEEGLFRMPPNVKLEELVAVEQDRETGVVVVSFLRYTTEYKCHFRLVEGGRIVFLRCVLMPH